MEFAHLELWPKDAAGQPEEKALLCTETDVPGNLAVFCSMLESFGIPFFTRRRGAAEYMSLLVGRSGTGAEVYVPTSRLEEARELLTAPPVFEEEPEDEE